MEDVLSLLSYVECIFIIFLSYKLYNHHIAEKVRNRFNWWLTEKSSELLDYTQKQCHEIIEHKYLITEEAERQVALEIIERFQQVHRTLYIEQRYTVNRAFAKMTYAEYFMYSLERFLRENNDYEFDHHVLYIETNREYFGASRKNYDSTCTITDYGMVYRKIYYMAVLFCERSPYLNEDPDRFHNYFSKGVKDSLDTKEITFWHRPYF